MKNYTVCICLDDRGGMTFLGKRQSRDRILLDEMFSSFGEVYVTDFSVPILTEHVGEYTVVKDLFADSPEGAVLFNENLGLKDHLEDIETIVLYKWHRKYPYDQQIDISFDEWRTTKKTEFVGSSHEKITKLVMKRRKK